MQNNSNLSMQIPDKPKKPESGKLVKIEIKEISQRNSSANADKNKAEDRKKSKLLKESALSQIQELTDSRSYIHIDDRRKKLDSKNQTKRNPIIKKFMTTIDTNDWKSNLKPTATLTNASDVNTTFSIVKPEKTHSISSQLSN